MGNCSSSRASNPTIKATVEPREAPQLLVVSPSARPTEDCSAAEKVISRERHDIQEASHTPATPNRSPQASEVNPVEVKSHHEEEVEAPLHFGAITSRLDRGEDISNVMNEREAGPSGDISTGHSSVTGALAELAKEAELFEANTDPAAAEASQVVHTGAEFSTQPALHATLPAHTKPAAPTRPSAETEPAIPKDPPAASEPLAEPASQPVPTLQSHAEFPPDANRPAVTEFSAEVKSAGQADSVGDVKSPVGTDSLADTESAVDGGSPANSDSPTNAEPIQSSANIFPAEHRVVGGTEPDCTTPQAVRNRLNGILTDEVYMSMRKEAVEDEPCSGEARAPIGEEKKEQSGKEELSPKTADEGQGSSDTGYSERTTPQTSSYVPEPLDPKADERAAQSRLLYGEDKDMDVTELAGEILTAALQGCAACQVEDETELLFGEEAIEKLTQDPTGYLEECVNAQAHDSDNLLPYHGVCTKGDYQDFDFWDRNPVLESQQYRPHPVSRHTQDSNCQHERIPVHERSMARIHSNSPRFAQSNRYSDSRTPTYETYGPLHTGESALSSHDMDPTLTTTASRHESQPNTRGNMHKVNYRGVSQKSPSMVASGYRNSQLQPAHKTSPSLDDAYYGDYFKINGPNRIHQLTYSKPSANGGPTCEPPVVESPYTAQFSKLNSCNRVSHSKREYSSHHLPPTSTRMSNECPLTPASGIERSHKATKHLIKDSRVEAHCGPTKATHVNRTPLTSSQLMASSQKQYWPKGATLYTLTPPISGGKPDDKAQPTSIRDSKATGENVKPLKYVGTTSSGYSSSHTVHDHSMGSMKKFVTSNDDYTYTGAAAQSDAPFSRDHGCRLVAQSLDR